MNIDEISMLVGAAARGGLSPDRLPDFLRTLQGFEVEAVGKVETQPLPRMRKMRAKAPERPAETILEDQPSEDTQIETRPVKSFAEAMANARAHLGT